MSAIVDQAVYDRLRAYAGLIALTSTRIYNVTGPKNPDSTSFPMVIFGRVGGRIDSSVSGEILLRHSEYQFSCLAATHTAARNVAEQVILAMQNYHAAPILASEMSSDEDMFEPEAELHHVAVRFTVTHTP